MTMAATESDEIVKRLEVLERENARLSREVVHVGRSRRRLFLAGGAVVVTALAAMGAAAAKAPRVIEAEGFTMLGPDGKPRIKLLTLRNDQPSLVFFDAHGQV